MQIIFLPQWQAIMACFILWPLFQFAAAFLCFGISEKKLNNQAFLFKTRGWEEEGLFYDRLFKVRKWKRFLPDGGGFLKNSFKKRTMNDFSRDNLEKYLLESCRAELTHWFGIFPFWVFGLFCPTIVILYMFIYSILFNLPCIIAQRFNRPRIVMLLEHMER